MPPLVLPSQIINKILKNIGLNLTAIQLSAYVKTKPYNVSVNNNKDAKGIMIPFLATVDQAFADTYLINKILENDLAAAQLPEYVMKT